MTASEKYTWGLILSVTGWLLFMGGIALSFSLIGACLGIPMAVVGLPMGIWGSVWAYQGYYGKQQEVISAGIREGLAARQESEDEKQGLVKGSSVQLQPPAPPTERDSSINPGTVKCGIVR